MTDRILEGKTVLMTGAGRGMERSMSVALAAAGAKVAMIDIDEYVLVDAAKEAEDAGGQGSTKALVCDVTDATRAKATAEEVISAFGSIDVLVTMRSSVRNGSATFSSRPQSSGNWTTTCGMPCCG